MDRAQMKKVGILGGTFDPPHIGHFIIADEVKHRLNLDEIWFIPTNDPPHKKQARMSNQHRIGMLRAATEGFPYFQVNTIEMEREGKSYTIETVKQLQNLYSTIEFYFIIGADMVEYLPHWQDIDELINLVQFVGVKRVGYSVKSDYHVLEVDIPFIEISSSEIKRRITEGLPINFFVPAKVLAYIKEHRLYGCK